MKQDIKVAVDAVIFGYTTAHGLSLALIKRKIEPFIHSWALPGGFVLNDESLERAVEREVREETGIQIDYLEQLYSFGQPQRDPRQRVVSITYFGIVNPENFQLHASTDAEDVAWFRIGELPELAFDHGMIIKTAVSRLKSKIVYEPIGFELLDQKFPFSHLEKLYQTVLDRPIDRRNFKKKIMNLGILDELPEKQKLPGAGRPGNLYRFNKIKYFELKEKGLNLEI